MLTKSGAKLMDFGLAKAMTAGTSSGGAQAPLLSAARTMSEASPLSPLTTAGAVIGTIQYMSPEQIEGKDADARSDLFALGAVLYEMTTGNRPFEGKSQISVASAILEKNPEPISAMQPLTPLPFERIVDACLAKNPDDRIQTAHDIKLQLKWIADADAAHSKHRRDEKKKSRMDSLASSSLRWPRPDRICRMVAKFRGFPNRSTYFSAPLPFAARDVAVAPNGHTVALVGYRESERKNTLWIYEPGSQDATRLPAHRRRELSILVAGWAIARLFCRWQTEKTGYFGWPGTDTLRCPYRPRRGVEQRWRDPVYAEWNVGHRTVSNSGCRRNAYASHHSRPAQGEDSHRWPVFLPDGIHFLFLAVNLSGRKDLYTVYVGSLNSTKSGLSPGPERMRHTPPPGFLLFYRDQTLFAQHFDSQEIRVERRTHTDFQ